MSGKDKTEAILVLLPGQTDWPGSDITGVMTVTPSQESIPASLKSTSKAKTYTKTNNMVQQLHANVPCVVFVSHTNDVMRVSGHVSITTPPTLR